MIVVIKLELDTQYARMRRGQILYTQLRHRKIATRSLSRPQASYRGYCITWTLDSGLDWTGLDWTGLDWTGLDWTGLDWTGMEWNGGGADHKLRMRVISVLPLSTHDNVKSTSTVFSRVNIKLLFLAKREGRTTKRCVYVP